MFEFSRSGMHTIALGIDDRPLRDSHTAAAPLSHGGSAERSSSMYLITASKNASRG